MPSWYEIYDNVEVQLQTRKRAGRTTGVASVALLLSAGLVALGIEGSLPVWLAIGFGGATGGGFTYWCVRRLRRLRRLVWCLKISDEEIVGYDYARRQIAVRWSDVERIDVGDGGLVVWDRQGVSLEIAHLFPDFPDVSHQVMKFAGRRDVEVLINGKPWQEINVFDVFPFLVEDASSETPGPTA